MKIELSKYVYDTLKNGGMIPRRKCSICNIEIGYVVKDDFIKFDAACGCSERSDLRYADEDDMAFLASYVSPVKEG